MGLRKLLNKHCLVPYALICGYGLFAVTNPPTTGDASSADEASPMAQPVASPAVKVAERSDRVGHD
ncbi:MAG: hypothetical protein ACE37H_05715 [Phycisphaeraceae bacterium]